MKKWSTMMLILLLCSMLQLGTSDSKKLRIGVIPFSVSVFDNQKRIVEGARNEVENAIFNAINANQDYFYPCTRYSKESSISIAYSDIEAPEVTIEPVVQPKTRQVLKNFCQTQQLDGVVFGHFQEEDNMIVVIRYYLAKDDQVHSLYQEENLDGLNSMALASAGEKLIDDLINELSQKSVSAGIATKSGVTAGKMTATETVPEALTANDVYKMIVKYGFYCEIVESKFHEEGLTGINVPKDGIFRDSRVVRAYPENKEFIKTESENKDKKEGDEKIILRWPVKIDLVNHRSFALAEAYINSLNKQNKFEEKRWRIPTILELFSIIKGNSKNHFPRIFNYFPTEKELKKEKKGEKEKNELFFWTSTPVKKEGTIQNWDKKNQAYFVVRSSYSKARDVFSITFAPFNIEGEAKQKAFLLPVYSDKVYHYKPTENELRDNNVLGFGNKNDTTPDRIPGFDDNDAADNAPKTNTASDKTNNDNKLKGFDDKPKAPERKDKPSFDNFNTKPPGIIKIVIFPYMWKGMEGTSRVYFFNDLNEKIKKSLKKISNEKNKDFYLREFKDHHFEEIKNYRFEVENKTLLDQKNANEITQFYNILSGNIVGPIDKATELKAKIMFPQGIDFIVTVKKEDEGSGNVKIFIPTIISKNNGEIYETKIIEDQYNFDSLKNYIIGTILKVIISQGKK